MRKPYSTGYPPLTIFILSNIPNGIRERISKMSSNREAELTHMAKRLNLELIKSKAKRHTEDDHQQYRIVDLNNTILAGENFDMSLDDVEKFLQEYESRQPSNLNTA
jgi:hypothetical protein